MDDFSYEDGLQEINSFYADRDLSSLDPGFTTRETDFSLQESTQEATFTTHKTCTYNRAEEDEFATLMDDIEQVRAMQERDADALLVRNTADAAPSSLVETHHEPDDEMNIPSSTKDLQGLDPAKVEQIEQDAESVEQLREKWEARDKTQNDPEAMVNASPPFPDHTANDTSAQTPLDDDQAKTSEQGALGDTPTAMPPNDDPAATLPEPNTSNETTVVAPLAESTATFPAPGADHLPSSGSKASLIEEMLTEDQQKLTRREMTKAAMLHSHSSPFPAIKKGPANSPGGETEDPESEADAPSSPVSLRSRFKEVAAETSSLHGGEDHPAKDGKEEEAAEQDSKTEKDEGEEISPFLPLPKKRKRSPTPPSSSSTTDSTITKPTTVKKGKKGAARKASQDDQPASKKRKRQALRNRELELLAYGGDGATNLRRTRSQTNLNTQNEPNAAEAAKARHRGDEVDYAV